MLSLSQDRANTLYVALVAVTFVAFVVTAVFYLIGILGSTAILPLSLIDAIQVPPEGGDQADGGIALPAWAWWLWLPLAIWMLAILIYSVITVARWRAVGYLYHSPRAYLPTSFYAMLLVNFCCHVTWVFVMSWGYVDIAVGFLALTTFSIIMCEAFSWLALDDVMGEFVRQDKMAEANIIRGMVHNGLAMYDVMCAILTLFNLGQLLVFRVGVGVETAGTIVLCLIILENVGWTIIDLVFLDRFARYVVTPYLVTPFWLLASLLNNDEWQLKGASTNASLTVVFLVLSLIMLVVKVIVLVNRHRRCPDPSAQCDRHRGNRRRGNRQLTHTSSSIEDSDTPPAIPVALATNVEQ